MIKVIRARRGKGFTLVEALLASVVLATTIMALTAPFSTAARNDQINARRTLAVSLAQELMEEILAQRFTEADPGLERNLGPDIGETARYLFDNIDDYDGYSDAVGSIADIEGQVIDTPQADGLSRHVTTSYAYVAGQDTSRQPTFVRIVVEVRYQGQAIVTLKRLAYQMPQE